MKKFGLRIMICICLFTLIGCQSSSKISDEPASIIENSHFSEGFNDIGLFWTCSFDNMYISVIFKEDNPQKYFAQHTLQISQIKTIQVYPDQKKTDQFIYMIYDEGKFQIDQDDIEQYQDEGRKEAFELYQKKINDLSLTTEDIGEWILSYFNEHVRPTLIALAQKETEELIQRIKKQGYKYQKEESGRVLIESDKSPYKIVVNADSCMIVDKKMDLTGGMKTGYMYNATLGSVGYIKDDEVIISYQYKDSTVLQGQPSKTQYLEFLNIKKWYDQFLVEMETDTLTLESL